jgi:ionotropic glutamate receptor
LSFDTSIGKVAKVAIEAAVEYVNSDPGVLNGTKLKLSMQDTKLSSEFLGIIEGTSFETSSVCSFTIFFVSFSFGYTLHCCFAALRFMENDTVAIIGPQQLVAHVISHIANELHVPLLSFAATDPTLNSLQFPCFVRTTQSDLFQMAAVVDIVGFYGWRDVIAIYIDDDHGRNGVAALSDKLAEKRCKISFRAPMSPEVDWNGIPDLLFKVAMMESRVIILHIYSARGLEVLDVARKLGMMVSGYVWIVTDWLSTVLDTKPSLPPARMDSIQGVLMLRMHTPDSEPKRQFVSRWSNLFAAKTNSNNLFKLNTYGLYAYDTVWLLAHALNAFLDQRENILFSNNSSLTEFHGGKFQFEAISIFDEGKLLLSNILEVNMNGLSGPMNFTSDGDIISPANEIIILLVYPWCLQKSQIISVQINNYMV